MLVIAAVLGVAAGLSFVLLRPPLYSSTSTVLLPPVKTVDGQTPVRDVQTEIRIATSDGVFGPAGQAVTPPLSVQAMARHVHVSAPTSDVISIQARAATPELARALSRAVASAEVDYVDERGELPVHCADTGPRAAPADPGGEPDHGRGRDQEDPGPDRGRVPDVRDRAGRTPRPGPADRPAGQPGARDRVAEAEGGAIR